ncbi:MAG: O-methyltransferase [Bacilli bacterium]|nr:O-methyltransferase [Bacilli bacterium]
MNRTIYIESLNKKSKNDNIIALQQYAKEHNVAIIDETGLDFLKMLIRTKQAKLILEIGTAIGYSSINFALLSDDIYIDTIERDPLMIAEAKKNIALFNLENRIHLIEQDALELDIKELRVDYDMLFIDAAKSQYRNFFEKYAPLVKPGGLIIIDNVVFHDLLFKDYIKNRRTRSLIQRIKAFNEWLKDMEGYDTYFFNIGDGIAVSIKGEEHVRDSSKSNK